ncbi:kelch-like protein 23 isoform X3 [Lepisosteus oculatus]|uniref:kelch-like protein 23 isoform X3 n=1 Tax=Lepisosteus oculatus TaxID=7918 RepID=UPI00371EE7E8
MTACGQQEQEACGLSSPAVAQQEVGSVSPASTCAVQEPGEEAEPDTVLQVGSEVFRVDRQQLAGVSPYFRALFYGGGRESTEEQIEIRGVGLAEFRALMGFVQTSRLPLDRQNVLGILETADFLQLEKARMLCCKFLERELHLSNCLGMMAYAWQLGCLELYRAARGVALTHLPALACEEDFLYLSKESVADLLSSDDLFLPREDLAFEVILRWATVDPSREADFLELAGHVRPECLTLSYLGELLASVKGSDPRARLICKLDAQPPPRWTALGSAPRGSVVVTGGYFLDEVVWYSVDWVHVFLCAEGRWVEGPPLLKSRHSHCAVGRGEELFVLGGSMDAGPVADVERLLMGEPSWRSCSPMVRAVERAAAVSMGPCIYVACGLDENGDVYSGIQRYHVLTDQWDVVSYSPLPRYDLLATVLNGALYLFGGKALRLDVETDEWTVLEEVCLDRKFYTGCSAVSGQVYLLGERRGNRALPNMVLLDPYTDTCMEIEEALPCPLPIHGCVTIPWGEKKPSFSSDGECRMKPI